MEQVVNSGGELHLLTGAYALDALDAEERQAFEEHLRGCATCRAEVRELLATAGLLGVAAAEQPPATLKERVMAEVDRTRQDPPLVITSPPPSAKPAEPAAVPTNVVALPRWNAARIFQLAAALVTVIAVGLGVWGIQARQHANNDKGQIAALNDVLAAPDAQVLSPAVQGTAFAGHANVVVSKSLGMVAFVGADLKQPPSDRTYELWFMTADGSARPAGLIKVGSDGKVTQLLNGSLGDAAQVGITIEPSGGSKQPTTQPVLAITV
jgi:anti-sigma-K factor RskA